MNKEDFRIIRQESNNMKKQTENLLFGLLGVALIWPVLLLSMNFNSFVMVVGRAAMIILGVMCILIFVIMKFINR